MARPRKGVTFENAAFVRSYFMELEPLELRRAVINGKDASEAWGELCDMTRVEYCWMPDSDNEIQYRKDLYARGEDSRSISSIICPYTLDRWVLKNISPEGWRRYLNNLRQKKHAQKNREEKIQVKLNRRAHARLSKLAKNRGISLDALLDHLVELAES